MKKSQRENTIFMIRENQLARTMQDVFSANFEKSLHENIKRFDKMDLERSFVKDFDIFSDDLAWIAEDFCKNGLFASPYAEKIASVIKGENQNLDIRRIFNERDPNFHSAGVCENIDIVKNANGEMHEVKRAKSTVIFPLAKRSVRNVLTTNLITLATAVHEGGHAVSARNFDGKYVKMGQELFGEIEAMLIEKVFLFYLSCSQTKMNKHFANKRLQPFADGLVGDGILTKGFLDHMRNSTVRFLERIEKIKDDTYVTDPEDLKNSKAHMARYVVGEVFGTLFLTEYLMEPEKSIKNLDFFAEHVHEMKTLGEVAQVLLPVSLEKLMNKPENKDKPLHDVLVQRYLDLTKNISETKIIEDYDEKL